MSVSDSRHEQEDDGFDELPSLFPVELSKDVKVFTIKQWKKAKLLMKKVAREIRENSSVIVRGFDEQVERCISCAEMAKDWLAEKPILKDNDCTTVYQWNKIGEIKVKSENAVDLDRYVPVLEILLSRQPFKGDPKDDSIQISKAVEAVPSEFRREDSDYQFASLKRKRPEPIGAENPNNIWRRKRKH